MRETLNATYCFAEVIAMILHFDEGGIWQLMELVNEEKYCYCLVDLQSIVKIRDYRLNELKQNA